MAKIGIRMKWFRMAVYSSFRYFCSASRPRCGAVRAPSPPRRRGGRFPAPAPQRGAAPLLFAYGRRTLEASFRAGFAGTVSGRAPGRAPEAGPGLRNLLGGRGPDFFRHLARSRDFVDRPAGSPALSRPGPGRGCSSFPCDSARSAQHESEPDAEGGQDHDYHTAAAAHNAHAGFLAGRAGGPRCSHRGVLPYRDWCRARRPAESVSAERGRRPAGLPLASAPGAPGPGSTQPPAPRRNRSPSETPFLPLSQCAHGDGFDLGRNVQAETMSGGAAPSGAPASSRIRSPARRDVPAQDFI